MDSVPGATAIKVLATVLTGLLSWRVWRFTIRPRLHPDEPKELPYLLPFIGHVAGFFMNFNDAIAKGRKHFQPSQEPFAMTVAGQTIYVATSADDIGHVWRNTKNISLDPLAMDMYIWTQIPETKRKALFEPHPEARYNAGSGKPLTPTQMVIELHQRQLTGARLEELIAQKVLPTLFNKLTFARLNDARQSTRLESSFIVSLHDLCIDLFVTQLTEEFWGPALLESSPNMTSAFMNWEQTNWKFLFQLPDVISKDMLVAKSTITGAFADYYKLSRDNRPDACYFATALEDTLREVGLTEDEMGKFTLLHYWAVVGNGYKLAFWFMAHLAHKPELLEQIRQEVLPSIDGESLNEKHLVEQCPKLDSLINETLRLTVASSLARVVTHPCVLGGKALKPGNKIMLPISELHYDPEVWGSRPIELEPNRFFENAKLSKSTSFRPWGGGHTLCPGRFLVRRSLSAFVAILLSRYEIEVVSNSFPRMDGARPSPGVVPVMFGDDVKLKLVPRS